jgi:very-short-patch-repair endonuclease
MNISLLIPILVVLVATIVVALLKNTKGKGRTGTYRRRKLMTDNEEEFFGRLVVALPDHYIFTQVAMSALLDAASSHKRTAHGDRLRIAQQRVDYVVCTRSCEVVAVVELDDRTHSRAKDQLRDARLEQAGIRTVRFQARQKPKVEAIRAMILGSAMAEASKAPNEPARQVAATADNTPFVPQ